MLLQKYNFVWTHFEDFMALFEDFMILFEEKQSGPD